MGFFGKCVYVYWKLTLWTRADLEAGLREEKRNLLSSLEMGTENEGRTQQVACYRARNGTGGLDMEGE